MGKTRKTETSGREREYTDKKDSNTQEIATVVRRDPRADIIANYQEECLKNSDDAIERLALVLDNSPLIKTTPQGRLSTLVELEESLSILPEDCYLRRLPGEVVLRIIRLLPMTTMLALACTCKTFNSIINEQRHDLKNVDRICVDFQEFREIRVVLLNIRRHRTDHLNLVERYFHCSRVPVDNDIDNALFKLRCSPEGAFWPANILAALLVNARVSVIDFVGEHGVLFEQAQSFLNLSRGRRPFQVNKITFAFTTKSVLSVAYCIFWTKLLQPNVLNFYSPCVGVYLKPKDYHSLMVQEVVRVTFYHVVNLTASVIHHIIKEWFRGRRRFLPTIEIAFHNTSEIQLKIEELLRKITYEPPEEKKLVIRDHQPSTKNESDAATSSATTESNAVTSNATTESNAVTSNATTESNAVTSNATTESNSITSNATTESNATTSNATTESNAVTSNATTESNAVTSNSTTESNSTTSNATTESDATLSNATTESNAVTSNATTESNAITEPNSLVNP